MHTLEILNLYHVKNIFVYQTYQLTTQTLFLQLCSVNIKSFFYLKQQQQKKKKKNSEKKRIKNIYNESCMQDQKKKFIQIKML